MNSWPLKKMSEVTRLVTDGKHGDCKDEKDSGYFFLSSKDLRDGRLQYDNPRQISYEGFIETHRRTNLEPGDLLLANCGASIGRVGIAQDDPRIYKTTFQKSISVIKANHEIVDNRFLYYFLALKSALLIRLGNGAAQPNLLIGDLKRIEVPIPPLPLQQRFAGILSAYDELIENSQRRIRILEEMARSLYREWFVHFHFPGHENHRRVVSPLGEIPNGWEITNLGNLVEINKGRNITKKKIRLGDIPVVAGGIAPAYFHDTPNTTRPVITISASGANAGFVNLYHVDVWASDCSYIDSSATPHIYYYYLFLDHRRSEVTHLQRGSAQPHVYPKDLAQIQAICVPEQVLNMFTEQMTPIFGLMLRLTAQIKSLRRTRDLLLPRLLSGQIKISMDAVG